MPRLGSGVPLVARGAEMGRLRAALGRAATGSAGAVLLSGDAGVGKSRLLAELSDTARDTGALVLTGRCLDADETGLPYLAFLDVISQLREQEPELVRAKLALTRLLPDSVGGRDPLADPMPLGDPHPMRGDARGPAPAQQDLAQLQLFDAVYGMLADISARRCVLLALEDLHWADSSTRNLLSFLLARLRSQRLLVLGTYRIDDLHRRHPLRPLLAELVRLPVVERLDLLPFSPADSHAFVAALAEDSMAEDDIAQIADRSEGNAFFAEELFAAVADCESAVPPGLADVLLNRVERLSEHAQRVVRVASVAGRRVRHGRLRIVAELSDADLEEALREAVQHHVLVADAHWDAYRFRHSLLREAVYGDLLPGERVRLHAAYARLLAAECDGPGVAAELAHHSLQSNDLTQALSASVRAADQAQRLLAPAEVLRHQEQALKLWDAVPDADRPAGVDELSLIMGASMAADSSGEPERALAYARSAVTVADRSGGVALAADTRRRLARSLLVLDGTEHLAYDVAEEAWQLVRHQPPSGIRAWVLAIRARALLIFDDRSEEVRASAELAEADGRASGTPGAELDAATTLAVLDEHDGLFHRACDRLVEVRDRAAELGRVSVELRARYNLAINQYEQGDLVGAAGEVGAGVRRATESGLSWSSYGLELRLLQVFVNYVRGDWDGSEAAAEPPGDPVSGTTSARMAGAGLLVRIGRGKFAEVERLLTALRGQWHRDNQIMTQTAASAAEFWRWRGRPEQAVRWVDDALVGLRRASFPLAMIGIRLGVLGLAANADLVERATRRRDEAGGDQARRSGELLLDHVLTVAREGQPRTGTLGPEGRAWVARAHAEVSRLRGRSDPELWRVVVEAFDFGDVYAQAQARLRWAAALLSGAGKDPDVREAAAGQLRIASEVAVRLGAEPLRERVAALGRRARLPLSAGRPAPRAVLDPLTPRERSVLTQVALGRTNRQVGKELFISEKTVSVHLSRIMAKLGATSRTEAVAHAYDRGVLEAPAGS